MFREDIDTIVAYYNRVGCEAVGEASDVRAIDYSKPKSKREGKHVVLWQGPSNADDELAQIEQTIRNLTIIIKARNIERTLLQTYGKGTDELRKVRRALALKEVGRSPVEVALLYGYSNSHQVRELRIRHGKRPEDGTPNTEKPLTSRKAS